MGTLRAYTAEAVHIVDACCPLPTGVGGTLVNVNVTSRPCESWWTNTAVTVDAILAESIDTRVASTVIKIDFTVNTRSARLAVALVAVYQVNAASFI